MEKKIVGYVPRLLFRIYLSLKDKFEQKPPTTVQEKITFEICKKLITKPDSKLNFAPKSSKRFIKNDSYNLFVVLQSSSINIINHVYSYNVYMEDGVLWEKLLDSFDEELEKRRQFLEDEITNNIQHSLTNILSKLD